MKIALPCWDEVACPDSDLPLLRHCSKGPGMHRVKQRVNGIEDTETHSADPASLASSTRKYLSIITDGVFAVARSQASRQGGRSFYSPALHLGRSGAELDLSSQSSVSRRFSFKPGAVGCRLILPTARFFSVATSCIPSSTANIRRTRFPGSVVCSLWSGLLKPHFSHVGHPIAQRTRFSSRKGNRISRPQ